MILSKKWRPRFEVEKLGSKLSILVDLSRHESCDYSSFSLIKHPFFPMML